MSINTTEKAPAQTGAFLTERKLNFGCARCPERWSGKKTAHCGKCHETFSTPGTFDMHRHNGNCLIPKFVEALSRQERAGYFVWGYPQTDKRWDNEDNEDDD